MQNEKIKKQTEIEQQMKEVMEESFSGGTIGAYFDSMWSIYTIDSNMLNCLGYESEEEFRSMTKGIMIDLIHPTDVAQISKDYALKLKKGLICSSTFRMKKKDGSYIWIRGKGKKVQLQNGRNALISVCQDITEIIVESKQTKMDYQNMETILNSIPGGVATIYYENGKWNLDYCSENWLQLMRQPYLKYKELFEQNNQYLVDEDDKKRLKQAMKLAIEQGQELNISFRLEFENNQRKWVNLQGKIIGVKQNRPIFEMILYDLSSSEDLYRSLLDETSTMIYVRDYASNELLYANQEFVNTFSQYKKELEIGECCQYILGCNEECKICNREFKEDEVRQVEFNQKFYKIKTRILDWKGQKAIVEYITDCTNDWLLKKELEEQMERQEEQFNSEMKVMLAGVDHKLLMKARVNISNGEIEKYENGNYSKQIQSGELTFNEWVRRAVHDFVDHNFEKDFYDLMNLDYLKQLSLENSSKEFCDYLRITEDGTRKWTRNIVKVFTNPRNQELFCFIYAFDIEQEKKNHAIIKTLIEANYDYLGILNLRSEKIQIIKKYSSDVLGYNPKQMSYEEAMKQELLQYMTKENQSIALKQLSIKYILQKLERDNSYTVVFDLELNDKPCKKQFSLYFLDEQKDDIIYFATDITQAFLKQEKEQRKLKKALERAKEASNAKTDFLSRMSHDLRTPLNGVLGLTALAIDEPNKSPEISEYLEGISNSGKFMLNLVNDILDMSRIASGQIKLSPEAFGIKELEKDICNMIEPLCKEKNQQLTIDLGSKNYILLVDKIRLQQIIFNLLSNAVKFTRPQGSIQCILEVGSILNQRIHCKIVVADNGVGMTEKFQKTMYDSFSQVNGKQGRDGSGLGLAIVKNLVEMMGGTIQCKSKIGEGTEFTIELDMSIVEEKTAAINDTLNQHNGLLKNKRILLVEDHPMNRLIAKRLLEKQEIKVETAENGAVAVQMFSNSETDYYQAILMDIRMPVMDGLKAARSIRMQKREDALSVPIIAMTANAFEEDIEASLQAGMNAHLAKPINPTLLFDTLRSFI